ncbi:pupal cuticle protein 20-like [Anthonomus grandis grandis]|uniref:pupal cuticle protein 20-like n=1 Tax=Anthonomus grandis grandis TaxID=2921223 RepID=UPI0021668A9A|nr:pupal cuticle protein 20-like [Anthonomus grandis grandis]
MYCKAIVALALFGYVSAAKLDHLQYLPPQGNSIQGSNQPQPFAPPKVSQGGSSYPSQGSSQGPQGYSGPQQQYDGQPSNQYGAPSSGPSSQGSQQFGGQQGPQQRSPLNDVPILRLDTENPGDGTYRYAYETGNEIQAEEQGSAQSGWNKAQGSYRFVSPEGQNFEITYTADENGYVPQGAHLPTPPPIPEEILKSLELIRQAEASGNIIEGAYKPEGDDGQYHEGHDEGQYNPQNPNGGYQQQGGYQQNQGGYQQPSGFQPQQSSTGYQQGGVQIAKNVPQGFSNQGQNGGQQSLASNGGYKY